MSLAPGTVSEKRGFTPLTAGLPSSPACSLPLSLSLRAIEAIFPGGFFADRQLARDRLSVAGTHSNYRRPVSICRSDYFVPPERGRAIPAAAAARSHRQFAISCQFCYLVPRAPAARPGVRRRRILSALRLGTPYATAVSPIAEGDCRASG